MKQSKLRRSCLFALPTVLSLAGCGETSVTPSTPGTNSQVTPGTNSHVTPSETPTAEPSVSTPISHDGINEPIYSVSEALDFAAKAGDIPSEEYVVYGVIKSITNYGNGQMVIRDTTDETKELSVFGVRGPDGSTYFDKLNRIPAIGDTVYLKAPLHTFNDKAELGLSDSPAKLLDYDETSAPVTDEGYTESTIAQARAAAKGTKVKVTGVVAKKALGQGYSPNGFYLVDKTGSIYVYGGNPAVYVKEGNTVTIVGETDRFISDKEITYAEKYGYQGAIQISSAHLFSNDKGTSEFPKDSIKKTTRKDILNTSLTENITGQIFEVTAVIKKSQGAGFVNYFIDDLDQKTGSYTYTRNNGNDFTWLDEYLDKVVDLFVGVTNCKSAKSGCNYRLQPISVTPIENYSRKEAEVQQFIYDYYAEKQFLDGYSGDPQAELRTSFSDSLLGIDKATISYSSSNTQFAYFEEKEEKQILHVNVDAENKKSTITTNITNKGTTKSFTKEIIYVPIEFGSRTVEDARDRDDGETIKVKGIVAGRVLNQAESFYITDSTGIIACYATQTVLEGFKVKNGDEVVIEGTKEHKKKKKQDGTYTDPTGQANLTVTKFYGVTSTGNTVPNPNVISDKSFDDIRSTPLTEDYSRQLYTLSVFYYSDGKNVSCVYANEKAYKENVKGTSMNIYKGKYSQVEFLKERENKQVTMTFALCNWNSKTSVAICPLSATDGATTVYNTYSFGY